MPKSATYDAGKELPSQWIYENCHAANRHALYFREVQRAVHYDFFETSNCHLIQSAFDFAEARGAVRLELGAPSNQRLFCKRDMCPREHGKQMAAIWVVPSRTETDPDLAICP